MGSLNRSDEEKHSTPKPILFIMARGRSRFLVIGSLTGTVILWIAVSGVLMIRGSLHGLGVAKPSPNVASPSFAVFERWEARTSNPAGR